VLGRSILAPPVGQQRLKMPDFKEAFQNVPFWDPRK
jgi:hypothetical protein